MRYKMKSRRKLLFIGPIILIFVITGIVMWLWNGILPSVLEVKTITYWQAMGILVLSKILFGGFCGFNKHRQGINKNHFMEKIKDMSPEEREKFKNRWQQRFGNDGFCSRK